MRAMLAWLAPVLLCVVALTQIWVVGSSALSPWKLGGFGMYSGVDAIRARWIRAVLVTPSGELPVSFDRLIAERPALELRARQVRALPDAGALVAVAERLQGDGARWADCTREALRRGEGGAARVSGHFVRRLGPGQIRSLGCRPLPVDSLRLEVWRLAYAPGERLLRGEKLLEVGVPTP